MEKSSQLTNSNVSRWLFNHQADGIMIFFWWVFRDKWWFLLRGCRNWMKSLENSFFVVKNVIGIIGKELFFCGKNVIGFCGKLGFFLWKIWKLDAKGAGFAIQPSWVLEICHRSGGVLVPGCWSGHMVACHSMSGKSGFQGFSTSLWMAIENVLYIIVYNI